MTRPLHEIAKEIDKSWPHMYFAAKPYVVAMSGLNSINDMYYHESGKSVVLYFLANSQTWRGEDARRIKDELKKMAGVK